MPAGIARVDCFAVAFLFQDVCHGVNLLCEDLMFVTAYKDDTSSIDSVVKWIICVQIDF